MNEFDKRMRTRARAEDCPIPADFDGRLEGCWRSCRSGKRPESPGGSAEPWWPQHWRRPCAWAAWRPPPA